MNYQTTFKMNIKNIIGAPKMPNNYNVIIFTILHYCRESGLFLISHCKLLQKGHLSFYQFKKNHPNIYIY